MTDKPYIAVWLDEKATKEEERAVKEALERETGMRFRRRDEMTPQEKAEQLLNQSPLTRQWGDDAKRVFTAAFADIIIAAVEGERQACARVVFERAQRVWKLSKQYNLNSPDELKLLGEYSELIGVEAAIRRRNTGGTK